MSPSKASEPRVYLVGAGPGDPELLTMKAWRLIQAADVVVYDRLVAPEIMDLVPPGVSRIFVGKANGRHPVPQAEINQLLVRLARSERRVVRLKGGDPFVFGRGGEEVEHLAGEGVAFEVVPGITAAGCAAGAGIPLTHRGLASGVRFVTGHCRAGEPLDFDWRGLADPDTTLVVYMGLANAAELSRELIAAGLPAGTPAAAIERGSTPRERRVRTSLAALPETLERHHFRAPTLIVIGRVVALAERLAAGAAAESEASPPGRLPAYA